IDADVDAGLLACLAHGGAQDLLAAIDEAAGNDPLPVSGLDGPLDHDDVIAVVADDRRHRDFGILVEDETALNADQSIRLGRFQCAQLEIGATQRTEAVRALIVRMHPALDSRLLALGARLSTLGCWP